MLPHHSLLVVALPFSGAHSKPKHRHPRTTSSRCGLVAATLVLGLLASVPAGAGPDCRAVQLSEPLGWPTSAAWYRSPSGPALLVADVSRTDGYLFSVSLQGEVDAAPGAVAERGRSSFISFVRASEDAIFVEDKLAGKVLSYDLALNEERASFDLSKLAFERGGALLDLLDWSPRQGSLLGLGYVRQGDHSGHAVLEIAPNGQTRVVEQVASGEEQEAWFEQTAGNLTAVGGEGFFLDLASGPALKRLDAGAKNLTELSRPVAERYAGGPRLAASRAWQAEQALKTELPGSGKRQAFLYFDLLEKSATVSGILSWQDRDRLYLLTKGAMSAAGETSWTLLEIDPATGREVQKILLPTTAAHVTVIPPAGKGTEWAILERTRVARRAADGAPTFSSSRVLLIAPSAIESPPPAWQKPGASPPCG